MLEHKAHGDDIAINLVNTGHTRPQHGPRGGRFKGFGLLAGQYRGLGLHINTKHADSSSLTNIRSRPRRSPGFGQGYGGGGYDQPPGVGQGGYGGGPVAGGFLNPVYQPNQVYVPPSFMQGIPQYPQQQQPLYAQQQQQIYPQQQYIPDPNFLQQFQQLQPGQQASNDVQEEKQDQKEEKEEKEVEEEVDEEEDETVEKKPKKKKKKKKTKG